MLGGYGKAVAAQEPGKTQEWRGGAGEACFPHHSVSPPSVLPDISPSRGEIGSFGASLCSATSAISESGDDIRSPPLRGRC
ncbi:hypothetical protein ENZ75_14200, partial [Mesorhizobium sp. M7A.F.Ca.CA.002.04.1.1]